MVSLSDTLTYYKRPEIQKAILENGKDREVAVQFWMNEGGTEKRGGGFGKRPDVLTYESDVIEQVKQKVTSFHVSEEIWKNPLHLNPNMSRKELNELRKGWDLVLDIDCEFLEYSGIAADLLIKAIKHHGVGNVSCKFSGNHGFHIGVCFESFPDEFANNLITKDLFPEGPRKIANYLKSMIKEHLGKEILKYENGIDNVVKKTNKKFSELIKDKQFNPFSILDVDTILISSRHLYRMPYSFNEKSGLVSVPINPDKVLEFNKIIAQPENVKISKFNFLDSKQSIKNEAKKLIVESFDFEEKKQEIKVKTEFKYDEIKEALPEQFFPPCINLILKGINDGKKRALFILVNFLTSVGWSYEKIEESLKNWNKKNPEPLREVYLVGQIRYHKTNKTKVLPPNCQNKMYYKDIAVCKPDELCKKIKNPVSYSRRKTFYLSKKKVKKDTKKKDLEKK
jgi:DNA primase large subunit/DNA primase small subunit